MKPNALLMNPKDNVVVCTKELEAGEKLYYKKGDEWVTLTLKEQIPIWNKVAVRDILRGDNILKYGEVIGQSDCDILQGQCASHLNIISMPRNYDDEIV